MPRKATTSQRQDPIFMSHALGRKLSGKQLKEILDTVHRAQYPASWPIVVAEPVRESQPAVSPEPAIETEPVEEPEPAIEPEPAAEPEHGIIYPLDFLRIALPEVEISRDPSATLGNLFTFQNVRHLINGDFNGQFLRLPKLFHGNLYCESRFRFFDEVKAIYPNNSKA